jgi:uncharacterized protein YjbI with pentapeptide repeats
MTNAETYIELIKANEAAKFNQLRLAEDYSEIPLEELNLQNRFITDFIFSNIKFNKSSFTDCYFKNVNFSSCDLSETHFERCFLISANFGIPELVSGANLLIASVMLRPAKTSKLKLINSDILNSNFREFDFEQSIVQFSRIESSNFTNSNLSQVIETENSWLNNIK